MNDSRIINDNSNFYKKDIKFCLTVYWSHHHFCFLTPAEFLAVFVRKALATDSSLAHGQYERVCAVSPTIDIHKCYGILV